MNKAEAMAQLELFTLQLQQLQSGQALAAAFVHQARDHSALLQALPEKYAVVFHDLLDRLESGALFSEESCSFSQRDLQDSLNAWLSKATAQLQKTNA
jgi:hypothetical protein